MSVEKIRARYNPDQNPEADPMPEALEKDLAEHVDQPQLVLAICRACGVGENSTCIATEVIRAVPYGSPK